ncbi:hypothetical protein J2Z31_002661 [Sinorhizobium kostiense]|uniref:Succinoglycan biosynthesis protein n=1 Tax=Sinorhizobium kostiense TaxID=76747 RepID=A0ABS4R2S7_9HYPH|nr:hypothetical protein [Sinorhizobium kostiense]MBP2236147.1 hypothetical protein [Sinorhizobium kostiense]
MAFLGDVLDQATVLSLLAGILVGVPAYFTVSGLIRRRRPPPAPQRSRPRRKSSRIPRIAIPAAIALFGVSEYVPLIPGCDIKGNISQNSGERIYHLPGQEYYSQTRVSYLHGERWFCSEEAAREAGWRKAYN